MKKYFFLAASAALMAACSSNSEESVNQSVALRIASSIDVSEQAVTRAANDAWEAGDAIGLYAVKTGTTTAITGGENVEFTTSVSASTNNGADFKSFTATTPVYLPADGSAIDVYAYYPRQASVTPAAQAIDVSDQTSQAAIDWMTTGKTDKTTQGGSTDITKANPTVQLLFAHRLVKLQFNLVHGTGMTAADITSPTLSIAGLNTKANLNLYTGAVSDLGTPAAIAPVAMSAPAAGFDASLEAIILPYTTTGTHAVTLTLGSATYTFNIESGKAFAAGNKYIYNVTVNATGLTVTAAITDWGNGGTTPVTAE